MSSGAAVCPVNCPQCKQQLQVPLAHLGKQGRCPHCKFVFLLQAPVPAEVANAPVPAAASVTPPYNAWSSPATPQASTPAPQAGYFPFPNPGGTPSYPQQPWGTPSFAPTTGSFPQANQNPFGAPPAYQSAPAAAPSPFAPLPSPYGMSSLPPAGYAAPANDALKPATSSGSGDDLSVVQRFGIVVFVVASGFTALNSGGFMGPPIWFPLALLISTIGGIIGGAMLAPTHRWAGAIGGFIAGPMGLIAIAMYVQGRQQVWNVELVIVQCVACLPGLGVYHLLKRLAGLVSSSR